MDIFENVKMNVGMRQVAEDYGVRVNRNSRAVCPFHDDHNPSMLVKDDHYHCFACGAHGDVINFVADLTGLRPYEAAKQLARQYGLENTKSPPCSTAELYKTYCDWCDDNAENKFSQKSFANQMAQNAERYRLLSTNNIYINGKRRCRGYRGIQICSTYNPYKR